MDEKQDSLEKQSMDVLCQELRANADTDYYAVDSKAAKLFVNVRKQSEKLAEAARKDADDEAAEAAADKAQFERDGLAATRLAAEKAEEKAQDDARNAAIAEEEAAEVAMMAMRETGLVMGDKLRAKIG